MTELSFNPKKPTVLYIDLNSCFATVEQQANPHLRGKPIAVCAYTTDRGCILAPSVEAKRFGVKTGMRVKDGKALCSDLIILPADPWKYRSVHTSLRKLLSSYTPDITPKSIDEFILEFSNFSTYAMASEGKHFSISNEFSNYQINKLSTNWRLETGDWRLQAKSNFNTPLRRIAFEIKKRIKEEIGEWLTVSVGIAPNRFLAKLASNLNKPDGLDEISSENFLKIYSKLKLTDLPYIKMRNAIRLNSVGIYRVTDFYSAPLWKLKAAFQSINGYYWYLRLRGWEIDNINFGRKSFGNSYALSKPFKSLEELAPILSKLVSKMSARLRLAGYKARGVHLAVSYRDGYFWHKGISFEKYLFDTRDIYKKALAILSNLHLNEPVREISVSCFNLIKSKSSQLELFEDVVKKESLTDSIDEINSRLGDFVITPARMLGSNGYVPDRISFGGVKELEEFTLSQCQSTNLSKCYE